MKTIIGILLVGLLGFLGCSDSDDDTNTIGEATPVAPFGVTGTPLTPPINGHLCHGQPSIVCWYKIKARLPS